MCDDTTKSSQRISISRRNMPPFSTPFFGLLFWPPFWSLSELFCLLFCCLLEILFLSRPGSRKVSSNWHNAFSQIGMWTKVTSIVNSTTVEWTARSKVEPPPRRSYLDWGLGAAGKTESRKWPKLQLGKPKGANACFI